MNCCDFPPSFPSTCLVYLNSPSDCDSLRSPETRLQLLHPAGFLFVGGGSGNNCISVSNSKGAEVASLVQKHKPFLFPLSAVASVCSIVGVSACLKWILFPSVQGVEYLDVNLWGL